MTFKFFRLVLSAIGLGALPLQAQNPTLPAGATPAPDKKPKQGYMRLWNMMPKEFGQIQILQDTGSGEPAGILGADPQNVYATYLPFKPGRYVLKITRIAEPKNVLKSFDLLLRADVFVTFFARQTNGKVDIDMLDDTYDRLAATSGKVVVRQMIPGTAVTLKGPALPVPVTVAYGEERVIDNLPLKGVTFQMLANSTEEGARAWAMEVDLQASHHASLWLINDSYGRFRPRSSPDGQSDEEPPTQ